MEVTALTLLILHINHLIDTGKYNDISIEDVHHAIESKRVLKFLKERAGNDIDLSVHLNKNTYGDFETYYEAANCLFRIHSLRDPVALGERFRRRRRTFDE